MIINLTPHTIYVYKKSDFKGLTKTPIGDYLAESCGTPWRVYNSSGSARTKETYLADGSLEGVPLWNTEYEYIKGLPPSKRGVIYIISRTALKAAKQRGRKDCVSPHPKVRLKSSNEVIGCLGFTR